MEKVLSKDFIPKKDTQQEEFLQKYPEYDGRGIKIAIIDSGVDVSLDGLQKTSTGLPKVLDCFDFTGAGVVDTSIVRRTGKARVLTLLSRRKVQIPQKWKNPSNQWHLGIKSVLEILPPSNKKNEDDNKNDKPVQASEDDIMKQLNEMLLDTYKVDFIVWCDGQKWQACIIPPEIDFLKDAKVLTDYRDSHEYCLILDKTSCCVTIHNDGNLLEIFVSNFCHGSSVAQVAAAHFPGHPEKDGIAPGAQLILMNVLNRKVENNTSSLIKAFNKCIEMDVDIINLSLCPNYFNESAIAEIITKMVNDHGIIITQCAGNDGPFISCFNDDIKLFDEIFYIGSIFTTDFNSLFEKNVEDFPPFVWFNSSRGPLSTGARGVTVVAPADAIVENPRWKSKRKIIFDGTSCATPNVAGAIACLLSGLKANNIKYSPAMIKMALSNTAFLPDGGDQLGFGNGIIQINSAFEYFMNFKNYLPRIIFPQTSLDGTNMKGIVIYKTQNNPLQDNYTINENNQGKRISWISKLSPENHKHIQHSIKVTNNSFNVKIDTTNLQPGNLYYSEIHGFHPLNPSLGPIFRLPITVIIPENVVNYSIQKSILIQPPKMFKHVIYPPTNSLKCSVKLIALEYGNVLFENVIEKAEHINRQSGKHYSFIPNQKNNEWSIDIKWFFVLEIYIYQKICIEKGSGLKADLQICFDQHKLE